MSICAKCGALIDEPLDLAPEKRGPCAKCGSLNRSFTITAEEQPIKLVTHVQVNQPALRINERSME